MILACTNADYRILVSEKEIQKLDSLFDKRVDTFENESYQDLLSYYSKKSYKCKGKLLKSVLSGEFSCRSLGMQNINSTSTVDKVIETYVERLKYTLDYIKLGKEHDEHSQFYMAGVFGYSKNWYTNLMTDAGIIPLGPFKTGDQALLAKQCVEDYRTGIKDDIQPLLIMLKSVGINPKFKSVLVDIFPNK